MGWTIMKELHYYFFCHYLNSQYHSEVSLTEYEKEIIIKCVTTLQFSDGAHKYYNLIFKS